MLNFQIVLSRFACVLVCAALQAQVVPRAPRVLGGRLDELHVLSSGKILDMSSNSQTQSGVSVPGDLHVRPSEILVSGVAAGVGMIERWQKQGGQLVSVQSLGVANRDFVGVTYDEGSQHLFVLDGVAREVLLFQWDGVGAIPSAFSVWATAQQLAELENASDLTLKWRSASPAGILLVDYAGFRRTVLVTGNPPNHTVHKLGSTHLVATPPRRILEWGSLCEGVASVTVRADAGLAFEIIELSSNSVLATGQMPPGQSSLVVPLSAAPVIGSHYVARAVGSLPYWSTVCVKRDGLSESLSNGMRLGAIPYPNGAHVGGTCEIRTSLERNEFVPLPVTPPASENVDGYLALGVRGQDGTDPIIQYEGNALLNTSIFLPAKGTMHVENGGVRSTLDLSADPNLEGVVVLVQFLLVDGSAIRRSQIMGFKIDAAPDGASGLQGSSAERQARRVDAVTEWMLNVRRRSGAIESQDFAQQLRLKMLR